MKLSQGVEWGLHCVLRLALAAEGELVSRHALAQHFGLSETYLAKHLQALTRRGLLHAVSGPKGGFRLARSADRITVLDVVEAIEGTAPPFLCQEIRQRGTGGLPPEKCLQPCRISTVMSDAHQAWRESLRAATIAGIVSDLPASLTGRAGT